jgi:thiol-disulfide isomerase/thioredoxin
MNKKALAITGIGALVLALLGIFLLVSPSFASGQGNLSKEGGGGASIAKGLEEIGMRLYEGRERPADFSLESISGAQVTSASMRGKIVFLNFWATWCPPCRAEMPAIEKLSRKMKGKDFVVLALDIQEDSGTVESFLKEYGYTFPILLDSKGEVAAEYGVRNIPTTFILDKSGNLIASMIGGAEWDAARSVEVFTELAER